MSKTERRKAPQLDRCAYLAVDGVSVDGAGFVGAGVVGADVALGPSPVVALFNGNGVGPPSVGDRAPLLAVEPGVGVGLGMGVVDGVGIGIELVAGPSTGPFIDGSGAVGVGPEADGPSATRKGGVGAGAADVGVPAGVGVAVGALAAAPRCWASAMREFGDGSFAAGTAGGGECTATGDGGAATGATATLAEALVAKPVDGAVRPGPVCVPITVTSSRS
jgi:hypothetical protein